MRIGSCCCLLEVDADQSRLSEEMMDVFGDFYLHPGSFFVVGRVATLNWSEAVSVVILSWHYKTR